MVYQKISNDRKEQALYLLLEEGWEIERVARALDVSMQSIERWDENYAIHSCVKLFKPNRGRPRLLTGDMIDDIQVIQRLLCEHTGTFELETRFIFKFVGNSNVLCRNFRTKLIYV